MPTFDSIIIGAGQAGPTLAGRLTKSGRNIAFIERKLFGGTCVNTGCTPTKALVASAYAAHVARRAADYGVTVGGAVDVDMKAVKIFINVGGRALVPPIPGLDRVPYLTNSSMVDVDFLPRHLIVLGGSYVGLEFAQMYRRFGSEGTIVERNPRLV